MSLPEKTFCGALPASASTVDKLEHCIPNYLHLSVRPFSLIAEVKTEPLVLPEKARAKVEAKTLVLYVYAGSDLEAKQNLLYFIREGIQVRC